MPTPGNQNDIASVSSEDEYSVSIPPKGKNIPQRALRREDVAADLGKVIVWTFAGSIVFSFVVVLVQVVAFMWQPNNGSHSLDLVASFELFKTVSAVMSGPLGFVLGFYFRDMGKD